MLKSTNMALNPEDSHIRTHHVKTSNPTYFLLIIEVCYLPPWYSNPLDPTLREIFFKK
jgi:hypothetical protein